MSKKFIRKDKIELIQTNDENKKITVSLLIDSNHPNPQLDTLLEMLSNNVCSLILSKTLFGNLVEPVLACVITTTFMSSNLMGLIRILLPH